MNELSSSTAQQAGDSSLDAATVGASEAQRTSPLTILLGVISSAQSALLPLGFIAFGNRDAEYGLFVVLGLGVLLIGAGLIFSIIGWRRLTYTINQHDIRVESGVLSRSARSVPFERIQDVSLEQSLLPRVFSLVAVKFETGAGGGDDLSLRYLTEDEGERLRELVRERREEADQAAGAQQNASQEEASDGQATRSSDEALFAMDTKRVFVFGVFEFSLAVFAVLGGLLQYADSFIEDEIWDVAFWGDLMRDQAGWVFELGANAQALGAIAGIAVIFAIGSLTGLARTFNREAGFVLNQTARGFRRQRGLLTRTDVVMPVHRVQGLIIATRAFRYRFGWYSLRFVSLASDAGSASHIVAPFAKLSEIEPVVKAAQFSMPRPVEAGDGEPADDDQPLWHRATRAYRTVSILTNLVFWSLAGLVGYALASQFAPQWAQVVIAVALLVAVLDALLAAVAWRFKRHLLDAEQVAVRSGILSPTIMVASRVKLHSAEISQGPIARACNYATLNLGLAGASFAIPGIPLERARRLRARIMETIVATDFARLDQA